MFKILTIITLLFVSASYGQETEKKSTDFNIEYEKFTLENGLDVVFHIDRSDPVVAVALTVHVGSAREKKGRTGFAHLFEHLLFLESENLGKGGLDKMSARIGGSGANGSTSRDRTNYFQTVPKDALEKMLWAEADKLGWFINTVTEPVLSKEKQVVKNEKRQGVDNQPYGHEWYVIDKNLYPEDHPYNWQVIGSLEDLQQATLDDVKEFYKRWYVPNNTTLVVSGDFKIAQAKKWVGKYFDEIPRGGDVNPLKKRAAVLDKTVRQYHEDNFASLPSFTIAWPTVELYHDDSYALEVLGQYLSQGKKAPLYQVLVKDLKLTSEVEMFDYSSELAGQMIFTCIAHSNKDIDELYLGVKKAFEKFEKEGISEKDLNRIKAGQETNFYNGLSSVLGKGFQLAQYNIYTGNPGFYKQDIENKGAVSTEDVMRVYNTYIKGKNFVATSFVPKGKTSLALEGSVKAEVVEEQIVQGAEETFDASIEAGYERTASSFDRTIEPPYGETPSAKTPDIWEDQLPNGFKVYGIENSEVPLVNLNIMIEGGQLLEDVSKPGVANMLAGLMTKGTQKKTALEFEEAVQQLGATLNIEANMESINIYGNTLAKNYSEFIKLVEEVILKQRWDEKELELLKQSVINQIQQEQDNPYAIARNSFNKLLYGEGSIRAQNILGYIESVNSITMDDLKSFFEKNISPSISRMHIVGSINQANVIKSLNGIGKLWQSKDIVFPVEQSVHVPEKPVVYFYDIPDAKQSVLRIGYPALAATDNDYYPAIVTNYILGGGGFASRLTQQLRESKGYTYGARSRFSGSKAVGPFTISTSVRSNVTLESVALIKEILDNYPNNFSEKDLETTKSFLIKSNARAFETAYAKLNILENVSTYGWEYDYVKTREDIVNKMTLDRIKELSLKYLNPNKMIWFVAGDAKTQLKRLKEVGFDEPFLLNN